MRQHVQCQLAPFQELLSFGSLGCGFSEGLGLILALYQLSRPLAGRNG